MEEEPTRSTDSAEDSDSLESKELPYSMTIAAAARQYYAVQFDGVSEILSLLMEGKIRFVGVTETGTANDKHLGGFDDNSVIRILDDLNFKQSQVLPNSSENSILERAGKGVLRKNADRILVRTEDLEEHCREPLPKQNVDTLKETKASGLRVKSMALPMIIPAAFLSLLLYLNHDGVIIERNGRLKDEVEAHYGAARDLAGLLNKSRESIAALTSANAGLQSQVDMGEKTARLAEARRLGQEYKDTKMKLEKLMELVGILQGSNLTPEQKEEFRDILVALNVKMKELSQAFKILLDSASDDAERADMQSAYDGRE